MGQMQGGIQRGRPQLQPISIEEIVQSDVVKAEPDTPISEVAARMAENDVGSVVLVEEQKPVGVVTDRGIALSLQEEPDISDRTAEDVSSESLVTGTTEMSVFDVLERLGDEEIRRLPIVDEDGNLEGIVTLDDLIFYLSFELENAAEIIEAQSPRL